MPRDHKTRVITMQRTGIIGRCVQTMDARPSLSGPAAVSGEEAAQPDGHLVSVRSSDVLFSAWTKTSSEAEALHEARPQWRISIDGKHVVFSREGRIADLV